jgi:hypothetical protein
MKKTRSKKSRDTVPLNAVNCGHSMLITAYLKVYSSHSNWGTRIDSFDPMLKSRCPASF